MSQNPSQNSNYRQDFISKIVGWAQAREMAETCRGRGGKIVFTNGCFDLIHVGHIRYMAEARSLGDFLVVGLNSDESIKKIKGPGQPITPQDQRSEIMAALVFVDAVVMFDQPDPLELIKHIQPDFLVKGADWAIDQIVGREVVEAAGGEIKSISLTPGISTSGIISRIKNF